MMPSPSSPIRALAAEIRSAAAAIGLPFVAACANISSARPVVDEDGTPVPRLFEFSERDYWQQGDLALQNAVIAVVRCLAEPFYYRDGSIGSWRLLDIDPALVRQLRTIRAGVKSAIVVPVYMPRSTIGAVVWADTASHADIEGVFAEHATRLHMLALRFLSCCNRAAPGQHAIRAFRLTRREVQCLKLVAAGKTDGEIATIIDLSVPTVRFHLKKAGTKLGEQGRLRIAQHAVALGFVGIQ